jgi:hypothetical protein
MVADRTVCRVPTRQTIIDIMEAPCTFLSVCVVATSAPEVLTQWFNDKTTGSDSRDS